MVNNYYVSDIMILKGSYRIISATESTFSINRLEGFTAFELDRAELRFSKDCEAWKTLDEVEKIIS